jgi:hypothetical protein
MSNAGGFKSLNRYYDMLAGNTVWNPWEPDGAFDSLATVTVPSGGLSSITFAGLPSTYKHLQIRGIVKSTTSGSSFSSVGLNFNNDSTSSYTRHIVYGNGSSALAYGQPSAGTTWYIGANDFPSAGYTNIFGAHVVDILDYASTSKNTTVRALTGCDVNGAGEVALSSTVYFKTDAITSIQLVPASGNFAQFSQYTLYGVK